MRTFELVGLSLVEVDANGPTMATEQDALDVLGEVYGRDADMIVLPVSRLAPEFFKLATGIAGAVLQKFTNYDQRIAIVGDISTYVSRSKPLQDFVRETNRRKQTVFAADIVDLEAILSR
jgi:hypothetical protein